MTTTLDSAIFGPLFSDDDVSALLTDAAYIQALLDVEVALARVEARHGIIPQSAAEAIAAAADAASMSTSALAKGAIRSGFPIIALVEELRKRVGTQAAPYVHWGATTQDIMDTARVLQLRAAIRLFKSRLSELARTMKDSADWHRLVILAGRTHGQQALPISFGLKTTSWLAPLIRHAERLEQLSPRLLVVQLGGAAGTLAAFGREGLAIMQGLAEELELGTAVMPWHAQRDTLVEFAGWLSLVTGSLGKMAQDIILMAQTEVGEVAEAADQGRGGSSTMPQKSNPITSELILAAARTNAGLVSAMHNAQIQEHERATHGWQVEWLVLPQMIILAGGALRHALFLAKNLQLDPRHMQENIERASGVILAEAAAFALTKAMARHQAEALVKTACGVAVSQRRPLIEVLRELAKDVPDGLIDWKALGDPANYLGDTNAIIDRVLDGASKLAARDV